MAAGAQAPQPDAFNEAAAASWSVAVTTRKDSAVRAQRSLYEAMLRLEREGAAMVDRQLHGEDIALSADTCCCIWTEDSLKVSSRANVFLMLCACMYILGMLVVGFSFPLRCMVP